MEAWTSDNSDEEYEPNPESNIVENQVLSTKTPPQNTQNKEDFVIDSFDTSSGSTTRTRQKRGGRVSASDYGRAEHLSQRNEHPQRFTLLLKPIPSENCFDFCVRLFSPIAVKSADEINMGVLVDFFSQSDLNNALERDGQESVSLRIWTADPLSSREHGRRATQWEHKPNDKSRHFGDDNGGNNQHFDGERRGGGRRRRGSGRSHRDSHDRSDSSRKNKKDIGGQVDDDEEDEDGWRMAKNSATSSKTQPGTKSPSVVVAAVAALDHHHHHVDNDPASSSKKKSSSKKAATQNVVSANSFNALQDDA